MAGIQQLVDIAPEEVTNLVNKVTGQVVDATINSALKIGDSITHGIGNFIDDSIESATSYFSDVNEDNILSDMSRKNDKEVYIRPDDNTDKRVSYFQDGKKHKLKFDPDKYDKNSILMKKLNEAKSLFNFNERKLKILFELIREPDLILEFEKIQRHLTEK